MHLVGSERSSLPILKHVGSIATPFLKMVSKRSFAEFRLVGFVGFAPDAKVRLGVGFC